MEFEPQPLSLLNYSQHAKMEHVVWNNPDSFYSTYSTDNLTTTAASNEFSNSTILSINANVFHERSHNFTSGPMAIPDYMSQPSPLTAVPDLYPAEQGIDGCALTGSPNVWQPSNVDLINAHTTPRSFHWENEFHINNTAGGFTSVESPIGLSYGESNTAIDQAHAYDSETLKNTSGLTYEQDLPSTSTIVQPNSCTNMLANHTDENVVYYHSCGVCTVDTHTKSPSYLNQAFDGDIVAMQEIPYGFSAIQSENLECAKPTVDTDDDTAKQLTFINETGKALRHELPQTKSTFQNYIFSFGLKAEPLETKRKRKSFTDEEKHKVKLVRRNHACACCRARKISCSSNDICKPCLKRVKSSALAGEICVRNKLQDIYVGVKDLHGKSFSARRTNLQKFLEALIGPAQNIVLSIDSDSGKPAADLQLQVMRCSAPSQCRWKRLEKVSGIYVTSAIISGDRYVILPNSLPSIDALDVFGRKALSASEGFQSSDLTFLLDRFLHQYNCSDSDTKLRYLTNLTSRVASLNNLVAYGFVKFRDGSYDLIDQSSTGGGEERYVSEVVHDQIRLLAGTGLEPAERRLFLELDNVNKIIASQTHARIIVGICLLRLMLLYRDRYVRDEIRASLPNHNQWHQFRIEKAAFMYRRLAVSFGSLCRGHDSPLTVDWEDGVGQDGVNGLFRKLYTQKLKPAFLQFCDKLSRQHDDVFKALIAVPLEQNATKRRKI